MRRQRGMTLVEVSAAILISTIILGLLFLLVERSLKDWYTTSEETELRNQADIALRYIQNDLNASNGMICNAVYPNTTTSATINGKLYEFKNDGFYCDHRKLSAGNYDFSQSYFSLKGNIVLLHISIRSKNLTYTIDTSSRYYFNLSS